MQQISCPLFRRQSFQDQKKSRRQGGDPLQVPLGVAVAWGLYGLRQPGADIADPAAVRSAQQVEAAPRADRRQPSGGIFDLFELGAVPFQEGVLHRILGVG